jgi:hypothetical protein
VTGWASFYLHKQKTPGTTPIPGVSNERGFFFVPRRIKSAGVKNLFQFYFIPFRRIFYDPDQESSFYNRVFLALLFKEISPDWDRTAFIPDLSRLNGDFPPSKTHNMNFSAKSSIFLPNPLNIFNLSFLLGRFQTFLYFLHVSNG